MKIMLFKNIPSYNWNRIERKAKSLSVYGVSVKLTDIYRDKLGRELITVDLTIPDTLETGAWAFLGIKKVCEAGTLFLGDIPSNYRNDSMHCEHCNSNRARNSVIIIKDNETGDIKQIGKTCVKKYLGSSLSQFGNLLLTIDDLLTYEDYEDIGFSLSGKYMNVHEFLWYCMEDIKIRGYIKTNTYDYNGNLIPATSDVARKMQRESTGITQEQENEVIEAIACYKGFASKKMDDFAKNVLTLLECKYIESKYKNMIAFVPKFLINKRQWEQEKREQEKINESLVGGYLGEEKDKIEFTATLINERTFENAYGLTFIYTFLTDTGYLVQWKTSKFLPFESMLVDIYGHNPDTEQIIKDKVKLTIKGTIKNHNEFKGRCYTVCTRCKLLLAIK